MTTSPSNLERALPPRLMRLSWLARARLVWETYAPVLAIPALALALFVILTLLGTWEVAGDPLRLLALLGVVGLIARGVWHAKDLRVPTESDALRRLETTAGLEHRPLDVLRDAPVLAPELWPAHVAQARSQADGIRCVGRVPALTPIDRYGLRFIAPILVVIAIVLAWGIGLERLRHSLKPGLLPMTNPYAVTFEAWVDPPDYTGRPPIYAQGDGPILAPVGSTFVVRASGARGLPRPKYVAGEDGARTRFLTPTALGRNAVEVRTVVDGSGVLDWRIGPTRQSWIVNAAPDAAPAIEVTEPPETDKQDRLVVTFDASDDYGVERIVLDMVELTDGLDEATAFETGVSAFETDSGGFVATEGRTIKLDLTRHPLAGRKVIARLVAIDGAGQRGVSEPFYTTVPDKIFVEPLAKAIVEQRGLLLAGTADGASDWLDAPKRQPDNDASDGTFDTYQTAWRLGRAPEPVQRTAELIEAVTDAPDPALFNDPVVYLGLRHVAKSLRYARSPEALDGLPDHMWTLANRAEFGVLGTALQEMREAQAALREGIARRAPQREIDTLFERYNQAVDTYMEELRRNAEVGEPSEGEGQGPSMGSVDQIQELLDAIEEANRIGDTEGARRALAELAELLENMQIQLNPGGGGGSGGESSGEGEMTDEQREQLEELAEQLGEQRDLQDETRQAERQRDRREFGGAEEETESISPEELARRQAEIETTLEALRERLSETGEAPGGGEGESEGAGGLAQSETGENGEASGEGEAEGGGGGTGGDSDSAFERALQAMQDSEDALARGDLGGSREAQGEAIDALRDVGDALAAEFAPEGEEGEGRDPLGRGQNGLESDNAESDIDTRSNAERSREILEELRRRAAEAEREQQEQDYLDRLLDRF